MEIPVEGEFEFSVSFYNMTAADKLRLIEAICRGDHFYEIVGSLDTTVEVELPERDD